MGDKQEIRSNKDNVRVVHSFNRKIENSIPLNNYEFVVKDAENEKLLLDIIRERSKIFISIKKMR